MASPNPRIVFLTDIMDVDFRNAAHHVEQFRLAAFFEMHFQSRIGIEVVFNSPFGMATDDEDFFNAALQASSTMYWIVGLSTIGSISFGVA